MTPEELQQVMDTPLTDQQIQDHLSTRLYRFWLTDVVKTVVDGDTIRGWMELEPDLRQRVDIRISGINAPETNRRAEKEAGLISKEWAKRQLANVAEAYFLWDGTYSFRRRPGDLMYRDPVTGQIKDFGQESVTAGMASEVDFGLDIDDEPIMEVPW